MKNSPLEKMPLRSACIVLSLLVHLVFLSSLWNLGPLDFARPVTERLAVMLELAHGGEPVSPKAPAPEEEKKGGDIEEPAASDATAWEESAAEAVSELQTEVNRAAEPEETAPPHAISPTHSVEVAAKKTEAPEKPAAGVTGSLYKQPPERTSDEFLSSATEKLTYRVSVFGTPVGRAEWEARSEKTGIKITLKVKSDPLISAICPIDDLMESRLIHGNFIITRLKRQEGSFKSDRGFTIFLRERYVFWMDLLKKRVAREPIPNGRVLDVMSALYYLRNRPLQVDKTETLEVFNGLAYAEMPVEVLLRERVRLPGGREVPALKVRPQIKDADFFNIKGDIHIWLSDDQYKVPVKIQTWLGVGYVTADLVSAETTPVVAPREEGKASSSGQARSGATGATSNPGLFNPLFTERPEVVPPVPSSPPKYASGPSQAPAP